MKKSSGPAEVNFLGESRTTEMLYYRVYQIAQQSYRDKPPEGWI
jgi:hypothetical protein